MTTEQTPPKALMAVYFIGFLYLGMGIGLTGPAVPFLADQIGVGLDTFSYLFIIGSIGGILGALVGARGYDHWDGHKLMAAAIFGMALITFLIPFAPGFAIMAVLMILSGFTHITFDTGGNTLLIWWWGDKVGPHMNTMHFMFGVGAIMSPLMVGQVLTATDGVQLAYWIVGVLGIPLGIAMLLFPSPAIPTTANEENGKVSRSQMVLIGLFVMLFMLYVGAEVGFGNWVYTYAVESNLADKIQATTLTSLFWIGLTSGRLISIVLTKRFRTEQILWGSILGGIAGAMLLIIFPASIWVGTIMLGLSYASIFPLTLSWAANTMHVSGRVSGWFFAGANVGAMIFPWLIGQLFVAINPVVMLWTVLLIVVCMAGVMGMLQRKIKA